MYKEVNPFTNIQDKPIEGGLYGSDFVTLSTLQAGAGSKVMRADDSGFWLGAEKWADAPFRVDMDGNAVATSITVSGYILVGGAAADVNSGATTVDGGKITANSITASQIAANTITASQIASGTITANEIATSTITANEIATDTITANEIDAGTITATEIASGTITAAQIATGTITANEIATGTITATEIAAGTITANEIATGAVTASKISVTTLGAIKADLGDVVVGGSSDVYGTIVVKNSSGTEISKLNSSGIIVRNTRGLFFEETTSGNYASIQNNSSNQMVIQLPESTNQFFIKGYNAGLWSLNLFTVSNTQTYSKRKFVCDGDIELNDTSIKLLDQIVFNTKTAGYSSSNGALYYYEDGGNYYFGSNNNGWDGRFSQVAQ